MSGKAVEHAAGVLGIRATLYDMTGADRQRVKMYLRAHYNLAMPDDVLLHNSEPFVEWGVPWGTIDRLVFRGSRTAYGMLVNGFEAVGDARFDKPCIIRDHWREKHVTTHMQTKAVLAWSKSFYTALEYAYGCIAGGLEGETPGYLYFCLAQTGIDVKQAVRDWERGQFGAEIDEGRQHEVITPTVPRNRILATWELRREAKRRDREFVVSQRTIYPGDFAAVMPTYDAINAVFDGPPTRVYDYVAMANHVDTHILR